MLSLPLEIRYMIYSEILSSDMHIDLLNFSYCFRALVPKQTLHLSPRVLGVSRQVYLEASRILYQNTFVLRMEFHIQDALRYYDHVRHRAVLDKETPFSSRAILLRKQCKNVRKLRIQYETARPLHHWLTGNLLETDVQLINLDLILEQLTGLVRVNRGEEQSPEQPHDWLPAAGGNMGLANSMVKLMDWYRWSATTKIADQCAAVSRVAFSPS